MEYRVSTLSIILIAVAAITAAGGVIALFVYLKKKRNASVKAFFGGWIAFLFAVLLLESLVHSLVLGSEAGQTIRGNPLLFAVYGGVMAGLFEETARYICFSQFLKAEQENDWNALMYGTGHGGCEVFNLFVVTMINNLIYAVTLNTSGPDAILQSASGDVLVQLEEMIRQLCTAPPYMFLLSLVERVAAMALHLSLSVLVFYAVKKKSCRKYYLIAIMIHALVDFIAAYGGGIMPTALLEAVIVLCSAAAGWYAWRVWKCNHIES